MSLGSSGYLERSSIPKAPIITSLTSVDWSRSSELSKLGMCAARVAESISNVARKLTAGVGPDASLGDVLVS